MNDTFLDVIAALDTDRELSALSEHVAVVSPLALELLARERVSTVGLEARRVATTQLRVVRELVGNLRRLEGVSADPRVEPGVRVALAGLLGSLTDDTELLPVAGCEAAALLEPALLVHVLLGHLEPWLPPMLLALEPEPALGQLQLGIPDYLHPLMQQRFEALWELFHRLRTQCAARLAVLVDAARIDPVLLQIAIEDARVLARPVPSAPQWRPGNEASAWLGEVDASLSAWARNVERSELSG